MAVFECDNCGKHHTAEQVVNSIDCVRCGDTVKVFTIDAAEKMESLTADVTTLQEVIDTGFEREQNLLKEVGRLKAQLQTAENNWSIRGGNANDAEQQVKTLRDAVEQAMEWDWLSEPDDIPEYVLAQLRQAISATKGETG